MTDSTTKPVTTKPVRANTGSTNQSSGQRRAAMMADATHNQISPSDVEFRVLDCRDVWGFDAHELVAPYELSPLLTA